MDQRWRWDWGGFRDVGNRSDPPQFLPSENEQSMSYGPNVSKVGGGSERLLTEVLSCTVNMRIGVAE